KSISAAADPTSAPSPRAGRLPQRFLFRSFGNKCLRSLLADDSGRRAAQPTRRNAMKTLNLLLGAAALAICAGPAFAEDYVGGAVKSTEIGGKEVLTDANGMTLYVYDKD